MINLILENFCFTMLVCALFFCALWIFFFIRKIKKMQHQLSYVLSLKEYDNFTPIKNSALLYGLSQLIKKTLHQLHKSQLDETQVRSAYEIAHDLRSPVRKVQQTLQSHDPEDKLNLTSSLEHIISLTKDLVQNNGKKKAATQSDFLVSQVLQDLVQRKQEHHPAIEIQWVQDPGFTEVMTTIDLTSFMRIFENCLDSSIDALNNHGKIVLRTRTRNVAIKIDISSNGPGIEKNLLTKINKIFDSISYSDFALAPIIAKRIARRHGGNLEVRSLVGIGTTLSIIIPRKRPQ